MAHLPYFLLVYTRIIHQSVMYTYQKGVKGKLKERSGNNFLLRIKTEKKVHIYQKQAILLCLITFPAMLNNISLPGFFYQGLHAFDFFSTQQHEQLLHLAAANCHKSVVFFYVHLSHIFTRQSTFLYRKPTMSTLLSLSFLPLPIYKVVQRDLAGFGVCSGSPNTGISSGR